MTNKFSSKTLMQMDLKSILFALLLWYMFFSYSYKFGICFPVTICAHRAVLREIKADASKNAQNAQDAVTKYHLEDLVYRIDKALEVK